MVGGFSKRRYANPPAAAFDGEGSRRRGGRLTPPGKRVAYASSSLALASLEYFVNLDPQDAPSGLVSVHTSIPEGIRCERVNISFPSRIMARGAVSAGTLGVARISHRTGFLREGGEVQVTESRRDRRLSVAGGRKTACNATKRRIPTSVGILCLLRQAS